MARSINGFEVPAPRDNAAARALINEILILSIAAVPSRCIRLGEDCVTCPYCCPAAGMTRQQCLED